MTVTKPTTSPPNRRPSRIQSRRRFSSASAGPRCNALLSSPMIPRGRNRQSSMSPPSRSLRSKKDTVDLSFLGDAFDKEDDSFYPSELFQADPSHRHIYHREEERRVPLVYSSLPPSPISVSPPPHVLTPEFPLSPTPASASQSQEVSAVPFSLWDYLREELLATDFDSHQELKWERVSNFLSMPLAMEKVCYVV